LAIPAVHPVRPETKGAVQNADFLGPESLAPLIAEQFDFFDDVINEVGPFEADYVTSPWRRWR
jgi:hypothetical protein